MPAKRGEFSYAHCTYREGERILLLLTVYAYEMDRAEIRRLFDSAKQQAGDAETVSGLGDGAYW
jgi:hypothetical protein